MEKLKSEISITFLFDNKVDKKKIAKEKSNNEKRFVLRMFVNNKYQKTPIILVVYDKHNMRNIDVVMTNKRKAYKRYLGIIENIVYRRDLIIIDNLGIEEYEN